MPSLSFIAPPSAVAGGEGSTHHSANGQSGNWWRGLWSRRAAKIDEIRRLMLAQLSVVPDAGRRLALAEEISRAPRMQSLWLLRRDLTEALVEVHGELLARQRMTDITFMFAGLLERDRRSADDAPQDSAWSSPARATQSVSPARGLVRNATQVRLDH